MTACSNRKGRAGRVITAALVGALSVGAPAVALATGGVETLATDESANNNATVTYKGGKDGETFVYNGSKQGLVADTFTPRGAEGPQKLQLLPDAPTANIQPGYYYFYVDMAGTDAMSGANFDNVEYKNADGILADLKGSVLRTMPTKIGNYAVVSGYFDGSSWQCADLAATFTIAPQSLEGATIFQGDDINDTDIAWDGITGTNTGKAVVENMGVAVDGVALPKGVYGINLIDAATGNYVQLGDGVFPGKAYKVEIIGHGAYEGEEAEVSFTYGKCDLSKAVIEGVVSTSAPTAHDSAVNNNVAIRKFNGSDVSEMWGGNGQYSVSYVSSPAGTDWKDVKGVYTYKIKAAADADWYTGEQEIKVINCDAVADITYDGDEIASEYVTDLSEDEPAYFDLSKIAATYNGTAKVPADKVSVKVTKADGTAATADDLKAQGTYKVEASVYYRDADGRLVAQNAATTVRVIRTVTREADVFLSYDGDNVVDGTSDTYTGEDLSKRMAVKVYAGDKVLVEGTDYSVSYQKWDVATSKWVEVDSIVNAGTYRVVIKPATFTIKDSDGVFDFTVNKAPVMPVLEGTVAELMANGSYGTPFLPYTGETQEISFSFDGGKLGTVEIAESDYSFVVSKNGETKEAEVKGEGKYDVRFDDSKVENFDIDDSVFTFLVQKAVSFADVLDSDWYVGPVYQAKQNGYVNGRSGTETFAPKEDITRGEVACILFNMAGGQYNTDDDFGYTEGQGYDTGFSDVDGTRFYGKAIAWAHATGVVNGSNGEFRPEDKVTREEFAAMLANFAELKGEDVEGAEADLSAFADASEVSGWAAESVEWAVSQKVMGNGGYIGARSTITRAEVAAMAVNYQPEKL